MKISALRLFNVRRFTGRGVAIENIGDGVNVLSAANEHGKSTSFEALHALFFQPHGSLSNEVKSLRPYAGGNPLVEADIATSQGAYRITKQFVGGRSARVVDRGSGRVIAQADEAEAFIANLVGGRMGGPAGLLWVRQGITGIEKRPKADDDGERQARLGIIESVQGEVEAVTGGRRMAAIMAAVEEELAALVTATGRPKTGERYAAAIAERDTLAATERRLAGEVAALRTALDERGRKVAQRANIERAEEKTRRQEHLARAERALDLAKRQDSEIRIADAAFANARDAHDRAAAALADHRRLAGEARALAEQRAGLIETRVAAAEREKAIAAALQEARRHADAAEADERLARDGLDRMAKAEKALAAAERQASLEKRLDAAEAVRRAIDEGEAEQRQLQLPAKDVDALARLDVEIAGLRVADAAGRPSIAIAYEAGAAPVVVEGVALAEGAARRIGSETVIALAGIGRLTVHVPGADRRDEALQKKEDERRVLIQRLGVADLAAARKRQEAAQQLRNAVLELSGQLRQLAPEGLPLLRDAVTAGRLTVAEMPAEPLADADGLRAALFDAETRRTAGRTAEREAEAPLAAARKALQAAEKALVAVDTRLEQAASQLGPEQERPAREARLVDALATGDEQLARAKEKLEALRASAVDLASAEAELSRARSVEQGAREQVARLNDEISLLRGQIQARTDEAVEENWREVSDRLTAAEARVAAFAQEVAVLTRLKAALEAARSEARELYLKPVMTELKPLLGLLFDDVSITFDEKTLLPQRILRRGQEEDVERLSGGMREQLSVLTRLAFARLLARDGRPAPVILDDALVYSDDDRIEKMFTALHRQARDQQIIVFSCRQRAFQQLGGTVLTMRDWIPE